MKKGSLILGSFIVLAFTITSVAALSVSSLKDIPSGHWAEDAVYWAEAEGIVEGYKVDNTFRGEQNISRYENVQILSKYDELADQEMQDIKDEIAAMEERIMEYNAYNYDPFPILDQKDILDGAQIYQVCKSNADASRVYMTTAPLPDFEERFYDYKGMQMNEAEIKDCLLTTKEYFESKLTAHFD